MAALASTVETEVTGVPGLQLVRGTVTTDGDTFQSRYREVTNCFIHDRTTVGVAKVAISGGEITVTCTSGDIVDLEIWGKD